MNCPEFQELIPKEKTEYIGMVLHACMSHEKFYSIGLKIIKDATKMGLFQGVQINPPTNPDIIN